MCVLTLWINDKNEKIHYRGLVKTISNLFYVTLVIIDHAY